MNASQNKEKILKHAKSALISAGCFFILFIIGLACGVVGMAIFALLFATALVVYSVSAYLYTINWDIYIKVQDLIEKEKVYDYQSIAKRIGKTPSEAKAIVWELIEREWLIGYTKLLDGIALKQEKQSTVINVVQPEIVKAVTCQSCGAKFKTNKNVVTCPYCDNVFNADE